MPEAFIFDKTELSRAHKQRSVDWLALQPDLAADPRLAIEDGLLMCVEVKSSVADYRSGWGLNFVGDFNVLVCPQAVADRIGEDEILSICDCCYIPDQSMTSLVCLFEGRWPERRNVRTRQGRRGVLRNDLAEYYATRQEELTSRLMPTRHRTYAEQFLSWSRGV